MKRFRITRLHILVAGLLLSAGVVALFVFMFVKPLKQTIADTQGQIDKLQETIKQMPKYQADLAQATADKAVVESKYDAIQKARMPSFPFKGDDLASMMYMWDFSAKEYALMENWFNSTGALAVTGYDFPSWGFNIPTDRLNASALPMQTWTLSVTVKDLADLGRWLQTIPKAPRLMALQSVTIPSGRGPEEPLTAQVIVNVYEWLQGPGAGGPVTASNAPANRPNQGGPPSGGPNGPPPGAKMTGNPRANR